MKKLVIVQPYVPAYRLKFFSLLISRLESDGVHCVVAAGDPEGSQAARGDAAIAPWVIRVQSRRLRFAGKQVTLGGSRKAWKDADAVIVGHLGSSLDTYLAILDSMAHRRRTGVWGHIKSYVGVGHPLDVWLEKWQLKHVDHVFAYTRGGEAYARSVGVGAERITTVMNAIDTLALDRAVAALTPAEEDSFGALHGLTRGKVLAFIGGFDESKRIDFIVAVLGFWLVVWANFKRPSTKRPRVDKSFGWAMSTIQEKPWSGHGPKP
jgi:glycosyltransferase involved in cell wall biosynthesis